MIGFSPARTQSPYIPRDPHAACALSEGQACYCQCTTSIRLICGFSPGGSPPINTRQDYSPIWIYFPASLRQTGSSPSHRTCSDGYFPLSQIMPEVNEKSCVARSNLGEWISARVIHPMIGNAVNLLFWLPAKRMSSPGLTPDLSAV